MQSQCVFCNVNTISLKSQVCPNCGCGPREQKMARAFRNLLKLPERKKQQILEVGPSPSASQFLTNKKWLGPSQYIAIDIQFDNHLVGLESPHLAFEMDVCDLDFASEQFDVVICNHVLSFVPDYKRALRELFRVLRKNGVAFLQTALPLETTTEARSFKEKNPNLFTEEILQNVGTHWLFGRDYFNILRAQGFIPLRHRYEELEFFFAFKSTQSQFFVELSPLNRANAMPLARTGTH